MKILKLDARPFAGRQDHQAIGGISTSNYRPKFDCSTCGFSTLVGPQEAHLCIIDWRPAQRNVRAGTREQNNRGRCSGLRGTRDPPCQRSLNQQKRAEAYQRNWGGLLRQEGDDWLVFSATTLNGNIRTVRFNAAGNKSEPVPLGAKSRRPDNDNKPGAINLSEWKSSRYVGEPEAIEYLVDGVIQLGVPGMVAAMGDTGKSFALLELHRRISFGSSPLASPIFGGRVTCEGTTVMLTSEDDKNEVHLVLRLWTLRANGTRPRANASSSCRCQASTGRWHSGNRDKTGLVATTTSAAFRINFFGSTISPSSPSIRSPASLTFRSTRILRLVSSSVPAWPRSLRRPAPPC